MKLRNECDKIIESNHFVEEANKISVFSAGPEETRVGSYLTLIKFAFLITVNYSCHKALGHALKN